MSAQGYPIDYLSIQGFKSIVNLEKLPLKELNVLIGANGAGKSNFVSYFKMLGELVEGRLQVLVQGQGGADRLVSFGVKETDFIKSEVYFKKNGYRFSIEPSVEGGFVFLEESTFFKGDFKASWTQLNAGQTESVLKDNCRKRKHAEKKVPDYCYNSISNWKVFHFHDTSNTAGVKRFGALQDNEYLRPDAENLAAFLYKLKQETPEAYEQIRETIQLAIPFFDDFILKPNQLKNGDEQIRLFWRQKNTDYPFSPTQLSDGSIRFICLATALLQPEPPSTIIIDEPELGLHPYAITLLASLLHTASKRMQVIVSTQSVPLVNEFSIDNLIVVERNKEGASEFKRLDEKEFEAWLEEYSVGELWEKNILGGRPS